MLSGFFMGSSVWVSSADSCYHFILSFYMFRTFPTNLNGVYVDISVKCDIQFRVSLYPIPPILANPESNSLKPETNNSRKVPYDLQPSPSQMLYDNVSFKPVLHTELHEKGCSIETHYNSWNRQISVVNVQIFQSE